MNVAIGKNGEVVSVRMATLIISIVSLVGVIVAFVFISLAGVRAYAREQVKELKGELAVEMKEFKTDQKDTSNRVVTIEKILIAEFGMPVETGREHDSRRSRREVTR